MSSLWSGHREGIVPWTLGPGWLMAVRDSSACVWEQEGAGALVRDPLLCSACRGLSHWTLDGGKGLMLSPWANIKLVPALWVRSPAQG